MPRTPVSRPTRDKKSLPANVNAMFHPLKGSLAHRLLEAGAGTGLRAGAQKIPSGGAGRVGKRAADGLVPAAPSPSPGQSGALSFQRSPTAVRSRLSVIRRSWGARVHSEDSTQVGNPDQAKNFLLPPPR